MQTTREPSKRNIRGHHPRRGPETVDSAGHPSEGFLAEQMVESYESLYREVLSLSADGRGPVEET